MKALWLIAIIPVSVVIGYGFRGLMEAARDPDPLHDEGHIRVGRAWMTVSEYRAKYGKVGDK